MLWSDRLWLFTLGRLGHCLRAFTRVHACACVPVLPLCVRVVCSVCELLGSACQSVPRAVGTWRRARWTAHGGAAACKICFLLLARHVMSARLHLPPAKSDPIRRQDRARDNRAMRTVAKQPHLYMPLPTPSTNCSCPRLQEKDLCFRGMMLVKRLMCFSILFKKLFMLSLDCVNN